MKKFKRAERLAPAALAKWLEDGAGSLVAAGHDPHRIMDYTFLQFMVYLKIAERREAVNRLAFVTDLSAVVGSMFSGGKKGKKSPLQEHIESLEGTYFED